MQRSRHGIGRKILYEDPSPFFDPDESFRTNDPQCFAYRSTAHTELTGEFRLGWEFIPFRDLFGVNCLFDQIGDLLAE